MVTEKLLEFSRISYNPASAKGGKRSTNAGMLYRKFINLRKMSTNMSYQYTSVSETYGNGRMGCGIAVIVHYDDGSSAVLHTISDICDDPERIRELVRQCNENRLDPLHLSDVIDDFLTTL